MWPLRSARTMALGASLAAFAVLCGLPLAYMLAQAGAAASASAVLLLDARQRSLLFNTALLGGATAVLATLIGAPLGVALARVTFRFKAVWRIALAAPVLVPPYVMALAWASLSVWTYSLAGAVVVLSLALYPVSMLVTEAAVRQVEPRIEEAALTVASPGRVLRHIVLPLVAPAVAAAALVIFVLAISEFGVPALLRVRVFTAEIFTAFAALYDFGRATVLALPLVALSMVVALLASLLVAERLLVTRRGASGAPPAAYARWTRGGAIGASLILIVGLAVPLLVLGYEAVGAASLGAVVRGSGEAIATSLTLAAAGAALVTTTAIGIGYARARAGPRPAIATDVVLIVFFAVPSTVVGVGLIGVWNRPGIIGTLYGTGGMLLLGYLARFLPLAALALAAGFRFVPASHEEAAAVAGARWWRAMTRIVLPQMRLPLLVTWTVVFILAFGELGASILVAPPGESTLPIRIYTMIANAPRAEVAALALLQSSIVLAPLALLALGLAARPTTR